MRISEDSIREVLSTANIRDVVNDYVRLKSSGKNYVALCPFHKEKTPSFTVSAVKGLFHCFGCGEGGNAITFIMKIEKMNFVDAVEFLAKKFGVALKYEGGNYSEEDKELDKLYEYSTIAARFFYDNLTKTNEGSDALNYLKKRELTEETIRKFGIGYALRSWDGFVNFIQNKNYDLEYFEKLGLIIKKENGECYDRFRGRIIFPIFSTSGKIIAFGGRILFEGETDQPKYINSPESKIYNKRKTLYGLFQTKEEIRKNDSAILVEGYMDFLSLYQSGVKNVVASAGTSLTIDQVYLLSRITSNINLVFDGDEAGQKAAIRAIQLFLQTDSECKIITLPEKEDPDSFIKNYGPEKFLDLVSSGKNYIDFIYELSEKRNALKTTQGKLKIINSLLEYTARVKDPLRREVYAREIASKFKMTESAIVQSLNSFVNQFQKIDVQYDNDENKKLIESTRKEIESIPTIEKELLKLICEVEYKDLEPIFSHINPEELVSKKIAAIFSIIRDYYINLTEEKKIEPEIIINLLEDDNLRKIFSDAIVEKHKASDMWKVIDEFSNKPISYRKFFTDFIRKIKEDHLDRKIEEIKIKISSTPDFEEQKKLLAEAKKLVDEKNYYLNEFEIKMEEEN